MKKNLIGFMVIFPFFLMEMQPKDQKADAEHKVDIVKNEFPEAKEEIKQVLDGIFKSIQDKDADKLIAYRVYGPKFTEFRDAAPRFNSEENEEFRFNDSIPPVSLKDSTSELMGSSFSYPNILLESLDMLDGYYSVRCLIF